jgi:hypothetical protein
MDLWTYYSEKVTKNSRKNFMKKNLRDLGINLNPLNYFDFLVGREGIEPSTY